MTMRDDLLLVADAYAAATGRARGTVSAAVLGRGSILRKIAEGNADVTTARFEAAMVWFSQRWPDGAVWPATVCRPDAASAPAIRSVEVAA